MFHFLFQCFIFWFFGTILKYRGGKIKTCLKRLQNMLEAIAKHARREASETLNLRLKHPYVMFQSCNLLIIIAFKLETET